MARLNEDARLILAGHDVTPREWTKHHQGYGRWSGDACGCPDDRCIGHHHDANEPCGCLRALLSDYLRDREQQTRS